MYEGSLCPVRGELPVKAGRVKRAEGITIVLDNLNTHKPWSLYAAFPAEEAYRLVNRFEFHYTPEHGSLSMVVG